MSSVLPQGDASAQSESSPVGDFFQSIDRFNLIYGLPRPERPQDLGAQRLKDFHDILSEELQEIDDIVACYESKSPDSKSGDSKSGDSKLGDSESARLARLAMVSDWLGDIVVYCASEARRWGIPLEQVLKVIMDSNFSKLGADGKPIYDQRGKVMKGPHYWKPEPKITETLRQRSPMT